MMFLDYDDLKLILPRRVRLSKKPYFSIKKLLKSFSNLNLFLGLVFWLMIILIIGTITQKNIGLYQAQIKYFSSWYFWLGPIPLPSAKPTIGLMLLGLISQLFYKTQFFNLKKMGVTIAHIGAFLLLLGSVVTSFLSHEGSMIIPEGETIDFIMDHHQLEVAFYEESNPTNPQLFAFETLEKNTNLSILTVPFTLKILNLYHNSKFVNRVESKSSDSYVGFAKRFEVIEDVRAIEETENQGAMNFEITTGSGIEKYSIIQNMPVSQSIVFNNKTYYIELRNKRTYLPFSIHLVDFEKTFHPSTNLPKSFKSTVFLVDGGIKQKSVIQMNEPLRYKNYTFYQSSFSNGEQGEITNLAVVRNDGRLFPYIASIVLCLGLLIHLLINSALFFKKYNQSENAQ